jgi:hypothetical protein
VTGRLRECERKIRRLGVPDPHPPYTARSWITQIGSRRGRPIRVCAIELPPDEAPGYLKRLRATDYIFVDQDLPPVMSTHTALHELAHILFNHPGPSGPKSVMDPEVEREAELAAVVLATRLYRLRSHSGPPLRYDDRFETFSTGADDRKSWNQFDCLPSAAPFTSVVQPGLLSRIGAWPRRPRINFYLHYLWQEVHDAIPDLTIGRCPRLDAGHSPLWEPHQHWYQRLVGIHDAIRHLRPYLSAETYASARRRAQRAALDPCAIDAVGDAAAIADALKRLGTRSQAELSPALYRHGFSDIRLEAARLARIAEALISSPYVAAELARAGATPDRTRRIRGGVLQLGRP